MKSERTSKETKDSSWATSWVAIKVQNCLELGMADSVWPFSGLRMHRCFDSW